MDELHDPARYSPRVLELFDRLARLGPPPGANREGQAENRARGSWLRMYLQVEAERVVAAGFHARGCPHTIAAAELACEALTGSDASELAEYRAEFLEAALPLPPEKLDVRLLIEDAVRAAAHGRR